MVKWGRGTVVAFSGKVGYTGFSPKGEKIEQKTVNYILHF